MTVSIVFNFRFLSIWALVYFWNMTHFYACLFSQSIVHNKPPYSGMLDRFFCESWKLQYNKDRNLFLNYELSLQSNLSPSGKFHMSKVVHHVSGLPRSQVACFMSKGFKTQGFSCLVQLEI